MPIEINNNINLSQQPNPGEETKTGKAATNSTVAETETGKPTETIQVSENAKKLQKAFNSISSLPAVDTKKVEELRNKISNKELSIQGNQEERLEAASKLVDKIFEVDEQLFGEPNK